MFREASASSSSFIVIPALAGMAYSNHWIPAFAGMTGGAEVRNSARMAEGLSGWKPSLFSLRRHSGEGRNPGRQRHNVGADTGFRLIE